MRHATSRRKSAPARLPGRLCVGGLTAVLADEGALTRVAACVRGAADYFRRADHDRSPDRIAAEALAEALADDQRLLFVLEDAASEPVGLLDLALDAPAPQEVTIALLGLARHRRGLGLGREVVEGLFAALDAAGFERVRLGVAPGEAQAAGFWAAVGMWPCGEDGGVRLFERPLQES